MKYLNQINKKNLNLYFLYFLFSFHLFFWDIKILRGYGLRELISILSVYILYELIKENFKLLKINFKNILFVFLFVILITIHLFWNNSIEGKNLHLHSYQGLAGLYFLLIIIYFYYEFITKNIQYLYIFLSSYLYFHYYSHHIHIQLCGKKNFYVPHL